MSKMTTEQSNKLIANFMGGEKSHIDGDTRFIRFPEPHAGTKTYAFKPYDLKYPSSWDWLMPVVEKIEDYGCIVEIWLSLGKGCKIFKPNHEPTVSFLHESNSTIEAVWVAVIEFIEWYNKQNLTHKI